MIAGYGPVLAAAAPSTVGLLGRLFYFVGTAGIGYLASCWAKTTTYEDPKGGYPESRAPDNYLCSGTHGGALLVLPVAGPIMFIDQHPKDDILNPRGNELSALARGILYGSAAAQATGLGFLIASLAVGAPPSPQPVADAVAPDTKPRVHIAPALSPTSAGLTLRISGL